MRIVKVVHQEDAPEEAERWIRRLIVKFLIEEIKPSPSDIGKLLQDLEHRTG